ncbi:protein-glutamate O-methyltransferase CheR [Sphingomonas desiccabilis]|uniref:protein-glutamate O-methyltransferase n=1 Tax=Sphingomonas desiccabilis TaxID=429134 RepID=A0A4Q2J2L5_9SPHN|nr:protein-glutamate O-methyltransferase CheR [Sphingomonas desiccabilis]
MPSAPVDDPAFAGIKARIVERTGHHYYVDKDDQLFEHIARRMVANDIDTLAEYAARLADPGAAAAEWRALESAITINETFFFRFAEQFDVLRRCVLPKLLQERRTKRQLRIWSVGCSTGAEAHSVSILLRDLLGDAVADWKIGITGTDIDDAAIATAREARYTSWALRTLGEAERERLFDREGDRWRLKARYRGLARFEHANMMALLDDDAPLQFSEFDIILCRNVLIYFRSDVAKQLVGALVRRLAPTGLLFIGHAEPNPEFADVARPVLVDGVLGYARPDAPAELPAAAPPPPPPLASPAPPHVAPARAALPVSPAPQPAPPRPIPPAPKPAAAGEVRTALSRGDAGQALELAEQEALATPRDPVAHYLAALGALALGDGVRAERGFRSALYLDNGFAMAHYLLGRHLLAHGRDAEGSRALRNAARAAAGMPEDAELPEGDGMTAGNLVAAVRATLGGAA